MAKHKESILELCSKATTQGNSISVRMLEYLSTVKNLPVGFKQLATDFLDLSRILWSIEAGLAEAALTKNKFPVELVQELDAKFRKTSDDFSVLNQMLVRFLEYENKGTLGKFQRGVRLMFSGTDIDKMRQSLIKDKEALRMSSMVFRWSVGDAKADSNVGIGYTGLVAALERINNSQPTTVIPPLSTPASETTLVDPAPHLPPLPSLPALPLDHKSLATVTHLPRYDSLNRSPSQMDDRLRYDNSASLQDGRRKHDTLDQLLPEDRKYNLHRELTVSSGSRSTGIRHESTATASTMMLDGYLRDGPRDSLTVRSPTDFKYPTSFIRVKADPKSVPHWAPRPSGTPPANSRTSLLHAIQTKDCHVVERLLDDGADISDPSLLIRACLNGDEEIVRLLLLFGCDANAADMNGYTPLYAATKTSLVETVEMLMKYAADPNLSAGPDGETPLVVAAQDHNFELVHMLLMYNADASIVMTGGNTPLVKCIDKTIPIKIVELMLDYDTDANAKNREGTTALFAAIQARRVDIMSVLLDHGSNPNLPGPKRE
jgi:ankyrin repeat protein